MSSLQYKTRGDSNPKGKPKVYFCCHPEDFDKYFEKISQELLAEQNCAIWYLEGPNAEYDEQFFSEFGANAAFCNACHIKAAFHAKSSA